MSTVHIIIFGASGRMGERLIALARDDAALVIGPCIGRDALAAPAPHADQKQRSHTAADAINCNGGGGVVIDFSSPSGTHAALDIALARRAALLVGTTALDEKIILRLRDAARDIAILVAPNTSLGICVMSDSVTRMARLLGPNYHAGVVESHHAMKKDAPSGTAKRLAKAVRDGGTPLADDQIIALRGGDVIGEHTVRFAGPGEYLEVTHRATTRDLFARGAISAAKWLNARPPGWYGIEDVVGLR